MLSSAALINRPRSKKSVKGRILVLDDSETFNREIASVLDEDFDVVIIKTPLDALALCEQWLPDLIVLDVDKLTDGAEFCQRVLAIAEIPIIVASAHHTLESELAAFEAGATDTLVKPVSRPTLLHKTHLAITNRRKHLQMVAEREKLQSMAMGFLSSLGESGILMNFVRSSIGCKSYDGLAEKLVQSLKDLGISGFGEIRRSDGPPVRFRSTGQESELEAAVLARLSTMERIFQFRSQLVVNFPQVSIVAQNVPTDSEEGAGKIRDNLATLAETADALCENVQMRRDAADHAEKLQLALMQANAATQSLSAEMRQTLLDTRLLLHELEDNINRAHSWLGTTADQERAISSMMDESIRQILATISKSTIDEQMTRLLQSMQVAESDKDIELF